jgi:metal iron transporter
LKRWLLLYPLYVLSEIAIISTDLAELLGSAIALVMLFPSLPLWAGVLVTAFDVLLILGLGDPLRSRPLRYFELLIAFLVSLHYKQRSRMVLILPQVLAVMVCMVVIITKLEVDWGDTFLGYVPSKYIFQSGGLYTCKKGFCPPCLPRSHVFVSGWYRGCYRHASFAVRRLGFGDAEQSVTPTGQRRRLVLR